MSKTHCCMNCGQLIDDCQENWWDKQRVLVALHDASKNPSAEFEMEVESECEKKSCELFVKRIRPDSHIEFYIKGKVE